MPCFSLILVCKVSVTPARFFKKGRKTPLVFRDSLTYMSMKSVLNVYVFLFSIASFNCLTRFFRSNIVIPFFYLFCPHVGYQWNIILSFRILVRLSLIQTRPKSPLSIPLTAESSGRFLLYFPLFTAPPSAQRFFRRSSFSAPPRPLPSRRRPLPRRTGPGSSLSSYLSGLLFRSCRRAAGCWL